jgi:hypothetical protein
LTILLYSDNISQFLHDCNFFDGMGQDWKVTRFKKY